MKNFIISKFIHLSQKKLLIITLISVFSVILLHSFNYGLNLEYKPYNGDFQTFNSLRRILAGELPGRDFNAYLGWGTTYVNLFFTALLGGSFAASKFSTYFLSVTLHFLALINLFFLVGLRLDRAIIAAGFTILTIFLDVGKIVPIWEIIEPSHSTLSLRSSLLFIVTSLLLVLVKLTSRYTYLFYSLAGCLIGVQPFWSNDYGIPSCIILSVVILTDLIRRKQSRKLVKFICLSGSILISFALGGSILTRGHLLNWLRDNFSGIAADQFWYFLWFNETINNKIFELKDIFFNSFFYWYFIAVAYLSLEFFLKKYKFESLLLIYLAISAIGAGILSSVGGTISFRYYLTSILISLFIFPLSVYLFVKRLWSFGGDSQIINKIFKNQNTNRKYIFRFNSLSKKFRYQLKSLKYLGITLLAIYYLTISLVGIINTKNLVLFPSESKGFFWVEELGGWLPKRWQSSIAIARNIERELQSEPPTHRMLSTYSSAMDVVAGSVNPTGVDYIIHALGDNARNNYLYEFQRAKPKYITTLREEFTRWETWARRTNWWFYRELTTNYRPIAATFYNIIWERLERLRINSNIPAYCQIIPLSNHQVNLKITTEENQRDRRNYYVDVSLNYFLDVKPSEIPIIGKRGLVNAIENKTNLNYFTDGDYYGKYGMPPNHKNWHLPVEHQLGIPSILELRSYPKNRSKLTIASCQAKIFAPVDNFTVTRQLTATNLTNSQWKNGIALTSKNNLTGLTIDDERTLSELYRGGEIEFAKSGRRRIVDISGDRVWVDGSPLDSLGDGYPNPVIVRLR